MCNMKNVKLEVKNVQLEAPNKCVTLKKNVRDGENSHPYGPVNLFRYSGISPNSTVDLQHLTDERLTKTNVT